MSELNPTDGERVADAYLDAIVCIAEVIGIHMPDADYHREGSADREKLPASVLVAGENAMKYLATAAGILDLDASPCPGLDPDEVLARWVENAEAGGS